MYNHFSMSQYWPCAKCKRGFLDFRECEKCYDVWCVHCIRSHSWESSFTCKPCKQREVLLEKYRKNLKVKEAQKKKEESKSLKSLEEKVEVLRNNSNYFDELPDF